MSPWPGGVGANKMLASTKGYPNYYGLEGKLPFLALPLAHGVGHILVMASGQFWSKFPWIPKWVL